MKDRGSLIQLLDAFGIEQTERIYPDNDSFIVQEDEDGSWVILGGGKGHGRIVFEFDEYGFFIGWAIYE